MPDLNITMDGFMAISSIYIALNALIMLGLAYMVVRSRQANAKSDGKDTETRDNWVRSHGNNIEYVPIALLLLVGLEFQGAAVWFIHALGILLTLSRLGHGYGRGVADKANFGRFYGTLGTWIMIAVGAVGLLYLSVS